MNTSYLEFWNLYATRAGWGCEVGYDQLRNDPTVRALRQWPLSRLECTAPRVLRQHLRPLQRQLQQWLRGLNEADARASRTRAVRRPNGAWRQQHTLAYWNTSGPNGGLRRWG